MLMTHAPCTSYLSFYMFVMVNKVLFCEDAFFSALKRIWNSLSLYVFLSPYSVKCG